ncbi:MAG: bifunctional hydroxymethylpyrimidine kinase/phosphomethylpyrimidine kinase [Treponema sp.]|nr:bifunctional hydroxymethylpyrimidine kinase/phosphomethylpyrimidine kinase [Treponema sp.]
MRTALTIAGSDCSGGAGFQADIKTFSAHGVFGMSVVTSVVAENTFEVVDFQDLRVDIIEKQIDAVFDDIPPGAVKIGMLSSAAIMEAVAARLSRFKARNVVVDPVMYAKNGSALMDPSAVGALLSRIAPLADVVTPNIPEAEKMAGMEIKNINDMREAAGRIFCAGCRAVVVKGGHGEGFAFGEGNATDVLFDGNDFFEFSAPRINSTRTHGTGCTFSSSIAAYLALGLALPEAVEKAKAYVRAAIEAAPSLGRGSGPTNHFNKKSEIFLTGGKNGR